MKWGQEVLFRTNPDLADILGDMDFDFESLYVSVCVGLLNFQIQVPIFTEIWPGLGLGCR